MKTLRLNIGGEKGNAFYILGLVKHLGRKEGMDEEELASLRDKMTGKSWKKLGGVPTDYNHLVRTFSEAFPFVEIYAKHEFPMDDDLYTIDITPSVEL